MSALTLAPAAHAQDSRDAARKELRDFAKTSFKSSSNHCETFSAVVEKAAASANTVGDMLEDLKLVLIGEDWLRRNGKRGDLYFDVRTGSSGFKTELQDSSPQVEHAMAAIYLAKSYRREESARKDHLSSFSRQWAEAKLRTRPTCYFMHTAKI